jgi:hypothetical protein
VGNGLITVYTTILGEYDNLRSPRHAQGARFVCFSDRPRSVAPWEMQGFPQIFGEDNHRNVRVPKCLPHLLFPETEYSIFHDGAFKLQIRADQAIRLLGDADLALFAHPGGHKSIKDERDFYQNLHGFVPDHVQETYERYAAENLPDGEFWAGGLVIRRHTPAVAEFNELWFREYANGSYNDQFSLWYAIAKTGVKVRTIDGIATQDHRFGYCLHANSGCADNPQYEAENAAWAARVARIKELAR